MLLAYLDESYDAERYWLGAVLLPAASLRPLVGALDEVVQRVAHAHGLPAATELHGHHCCRAVATGRRWPG